MSDSSDRTKWEWTADEIRRVGYRAIDLIADHLTTLPDQPVFRPFPRDLAAQYLDSSPPEPGRDPDAILDVFEHEIAPFPFGFVNPRTRDADVDVVLHLARTAARDVTA
jgi:hypothetical protein